ncbi:hypothetical protein B0H11DRAFT_2433914 [Mycena galericulata]|nr:hypothetical protein B0H11DRAFT_2433914 [Mycena galericulata]
MWRVIMRDADRAYMELTRRNHTNACNFERVMIDDGVKRKQKIFDGGGVDMCDSTAQAPRDNLSSTKRFSPSSLLEGTIECEWAVCIQCECQRIRTGTGERDLMISPASKIHLQPSWTKDLGPGVSKNEVQHSRSTIYGRTAVDDHFTERDARPYAARDASSRFLHTRTSTTEVEELSPGWRMLSSERGGSRVKTTCALKSAGASWGGGDHHAAHVGRGDAWMDAEIGVADEPILRQKCGTRVARSNRPTDAASAFQSDNPVSDSMSVIIAPSKARLWGNVPMFDRRVVWQDGDSHLDRLQGIRVSTADGLGATMKNVGRPRQSPAYARAAN